MGGYLGKTNYVEFFRRDCTLPFSKQTYEECEFIIWKAAFLGQPTVTMDVEDPSHLQSSQQTFEKAGLINIHSTLMHAQGADNPTYTRLTGSFQDKKVLQKSLCNTLNITYLESVLLDKKRKQRLTTLEYGCMQALDALMVSMQEATNRGENVAYLPNIGEDVFDEPFDKKAYDILDPILKSIPGISFSIKEVQCLLWSEECVVVSDWAVV